MKFKVGDKVTVRKWDDMEKEFGLDCSNDINTPTPEFVKSMRPLCGKKATIKAICDDCYYVLKEFGFSWTDEMFEESKKNKDGNITLLFRDNKTIIKLPNGKTGVAKCNPSDKFDNGIGAVIATARAYGLDINEVAKVCGCNRESAKCSIPHRVAKIGEYIIAKGRPFASILIGEVLVCIQASPLSLGYWWFNILTGKYKGLAQTATASDINSYKIISPEEAKKLIKEKNKEKK